MELKSDLDALAKAGAAEAADETTDPDAIADTEARHVAYNQLKDFMKEIKGIAVQSSGKIPTCSSICI